MVGSKTKDSINFPLFFTQSFQNTNHMDLFYDTFMFFFLSYLGAASPGDHSLSFYGISFCVHRREKVILVWNNMVVSKCVFG